MRKKVPGFIQGVRFRNVMLDGKPGEYLVQIEGADAEHNVRDVSFDNVTILDSPLAKESTRVQIGPYAEDIRFRGTAQK